VTRTRVVPVVRREDPGALIGLVRASDLLRARQRPLVEAHDAERVLRVGRRRGQVPARARAPGPGPSPVLRVASSMQIATSRASADEITSRSNSAPAASITTAGVFEYTATKSRIPPPRRVPNDTTPGTPVPGARSTRSADQGSSATRTARTDCKGMRTSA